MTPLSGRTVIVVDDGIATEGPPMPRSKVARDGARHVVLAVPVAAYESLAAMSSAADEVVVVEPPSPFVAVGNWYQDFAPTADGEVVRLLRGAAEVPVGSTAPASPAALSHAAARDEEIEIPTEGVHLGGHLVLPSNAIGLVVFVHGSGSSRHSPRNRSWPGISTLPASAPFSSIC